MSTYASKARGSARRRSTPYAASLPVAEPPKPQRMPLHRVAFPGDGATEDQAAALAGVSAFLADPTRSQFVLAGAAGTGKTTTTRRIIDALAEAGIGVKLTATTNKALRVLLKHAGAAPEAARFVYASAMTVRRFVDSCRMVMENAPATPKQCRDLGLKPGSVVPRRKFVRVGPAAGTASLLIVDEASMLSEGDAARLLATEVKVLFVGDPSQLAPVKQAPWFDRQPQDAALSRVMRQAGDSTFALLGQAVRSRGRASLWSRTRRRCSPRAPPSSCRSGPA